jgi:hypothetical protein
MFAAAAHATKANVPNVVFSSLKASSSSSSKSSSFVTSKKSSISTSISRQKNTVAISRRISVRVSATNASSSSSAEERWQSMNVSLPNLRDNLDRSTTRNIDGKVYTLTLSAEDLPLVSDKFSQKYDARVSKAGIIEANLAGSVKAAEMISIGDVNLALDITKITGMKKFVEVINGRAAMIGITAALFAKIGTGQGVAEQLFSPAGIFSALFISLFAIASSVAPAALNKVTMDECFPDENKVYENERLPVTWTAAAEAVNGKVAMGVFLVALLTGQ